MEKFKFSESLRFSNGKLIVDEKHTSGRLVGEVETTAYNGAGRVLFKRRDFNDIILPGSIFVLEQLFKTKASDRRLHPTSIQIGGSTLNLTAHWTEPTTVNAEAVFGFMAGNGGATAAGTNAVRFNRTALADGAGNSSFMPFRIVSSSITQPTGYALPVISGGKYYYFAKKFSEDPSIVVTNDGAYAQMTISVSAQDFREFFALDTGAAAGINQIGLVAGLYNATTAAYDDVRLITTLNFATIDLEDDTHFDMVYKVYCL